MIDPQLIVEAAERVAPHARRTALYVSAPMSERVGGTIVIKAEHQQLTGSFKLRGALNKVLGLSDEDAIGGVITASSGNHGIGVATAASIRGIDCTVFLPRGASPSKVAAIARLGATIVEVDSTDSNEAEVAARAASATEGITYVSPYNDPDIIAGQGTIGLEILADAAAAGIGHIDAVVASVGGGGLISGIASWVKHESPETTIIGASPTNDQAMVASVAAGEIITPPSSPTLSDGTAGGIESDAITFDICRSLVDDWITVSEDDIASSIAAMIDDHHEVVEGAAAVALAAGSDHARRHPGSTVVIVTCGANISSAAVASALDLARAGAGAA